MLAFGILEYRGNESFGQIIWEKGSILMYIGVQA
jgi:hypothetical protein